MAALQKNAEIFRLKRNSKRLFIRKRFDIPEKKFILFHRGEQEEQPFPV